MKWRRRRPVRVEPLEDRQLLDATPLAALPPVPSQSAIERGLEQSPSPANAPAANDPGQGGDGTDNLASVVSGEAAHVSDAHAAWSSQVVTLLVTEVSAQADATLAAA